MRSIHPIMKVTPANRPIPTRFRDTESAFLETLSERTGLSVSELVRRSVRLLRKEMDRPNAAKVILSLV